MKNIKNIIKYGIWALIFAATSYAYAAGTWNDPAEAPPAGNVDAPVNVGIDSQTKTGFLWTAGFGSTAGGYFTTTLGVATANDPATKGVVGLFGGKIGATEYCDENGSNCIVPATVSDGNDQEVAITGGCDNTPTDSRTGCGVTASGAGGNVTNRLGYNDYCALTYVDLGSGSASKCTVSRYSSSHASYPNQWYVNAYNESSATQTGRTAMCFNLE